MRIGWKKFSVFIVHLFCFICSYLGLSRAKGHMHYFSRRTGAPSSATSHGEGSDAVFALTDSVTRISRDSPRYQFSSHVDDLLEQTEHQRDSTAPLSTPMSNQIRSDSLTAQSMLKKTATTDPSAVKRPDR